MVTPKREDVCDVFCSDREKVEKIKSMVGITEGMAQVFKAMADDTRLKIVYALSLEELCVCDVAGIIGSSVATASHHLRLLSNSGLAGSRREGKMVFYSLKDDCVREIINSALKHRQHDGRCF
ncbi:MAG: ArsR family transcriptional regulator [Peptococcaceae bacterium BICA1-7]|nr:MAG: ArsR family transcriptional regulator [Peptococcaceae bacterium BICA1-7]HBV95499.1 ArsR family transcriptional regulator [Desulfotomaculum sp.]